MRRYPAKLAVVAALTMIVAPIGVERAIAQLGTGSSVIGNGDAGDAANLRGAAGASENAPRIVGGCVTNRTTFRTQENIVQVAGFDFQTMPNTHMPVTHAAGCLVVDFAGQVTLPNTTENMRIRAWVVGVGAGSPAQAFLGHVIEANSFETRSMRFVFPSVPAGTHTVKIEWSVTNGTGFTHNRTLTVMHR